MPPVASLLLNLSIAVALITPPTADITVTSRRAVLGACAAAAMFTSHKAAAWCGETVPSWAFYLKWDDDPALPFEYAGTQGKFYCRVVGDVAREKKAGVPPVVVVGTPGLGYDYMENFEALTVSDRRVVEITFAGSSADAKGTPVPLLSVGACAAQLQAAIRALNVPAVHVAAHGLGAGAAVALARAQPTLIRSLALISPYGSLSDLRPASADTLRSERDSLSVAATILRTRTLLAKNSCVREAADASGGPLLSRLLSGSDGDMRLGGAALGEALVGCDIPVFLATGGEADLVELDWTGLPPSVTRRAFSLSGHLPFIDQREDFLIAYADFLDATDGVTTNRELKFADPVTTLKELASERPLGAPPKDCSVFKTDAARAYCEKSR